MHITRSPSFAGPVPVCRIIVVAAPAPTIDIVWFAPRSPTAFPSQPTALVPLLAALFANWRAPRRLQSLAAPVHAEAAVNPAPEGSSVRSTVIVVFGAFGTISN